MKTKTEVRHTPNYKIYKTLDEDYGNKWVYEIRKWNGIKYSETVVSFDDEKEAQQKCGELNGTCFPRRTGNQKNKHKTFNPVIKKITSHFPNWDFSMITWDTEGNRKLWCKGKNCHESFIVGKVQIKLKGE